MKTSIKQIILGTALTVNMGFIGCFDSATETASDTSSNQSTLTQLSDSILVPTYNNLAAKAGLLADLAQKISDSNATQSDLDKLANAWRDARVPWEQSEAFLFGPVAYQNLDPALDSWPVDEAQLDKVLSSGQELSPEFIADGLGYVLKGFHTAEYLIFRSGSIRKIGDLSPREREYLASVSQVLADDAQTLADAWTGDKGFAVEYKNAGLAGSRFQSSKDAIQETFEKSLEILDEVGNGKIADPYKSKDPNQVESQFAYNSLRDFADNIRSVRHIWTGSLTSNQISGLGKVADASKSGLGVSVLADIDASIKAIEAIPEPFSTHLNSSSEIDAALAALSKLQNRFDTEIRASLGL